MTLHLAAINNVNGLDDSPFPEVLHGTKDKLRKWGEAAAKRIREVREHARVAC